MYVLKHIPEDFIVTEEYPLPIQEQGSFAYFKLKKKNHSTHYALHLVAKKLGIQEKRIGFAGNKDKIAITSQFISIKDGNKGMAFEDENLSLTFQGYGDKEVFLGGLTKNNFTITIRNLDEEQVKKVQTYHQKSITMPNKFGEQRFSKYNVEIGKALLKKDYETAIELIITSGSEFTKRIEEHLEQQKGNSVGALQVLPQNLLKLYAHAYQAAVFNTMLDAGLGEQRKTLALPGFGVEGDDIVWKFLEHDSISSRDFINKQIPQLTLEGEPRASFVAIENFAIIEEKEDQFFEGKKALTVSFCLAKGSYATEAVKFLLRQSS